jgi:L-fuculose-phosphate aldolase
VDATQVDQLIDATRRVLASGAIGANGHGNVSIRAAGGDEMYFTSAASLTGLTAEGIARVGLDGTLIEGRLPPIQGAVVDMHLARYRASDEVGCVLHTHSPFATAFAVARRPIACWIEAMAMFGLADGVPVAGYGPRGSAEAIAHIDAAVRPGVPAVLLANHGVLVFHRSPELAVLVGSVVEEAAQAAINASLLGGPVVIPKDLREAALQRTIAFAAAGTITKGPAPRGSGPFDSAGGDQPSGQKEGGSAPS